ncbi:unnamed protein product [Lactuca saligna]|uniref:Protein COFACTOR ASSEMBLY OF COMPLEX C SUBUNIT B CCB4, chloroplastic n=1 Tax=Lactuca saligna TaxID=75948 RepID=A0AA35ZMX3_LACSI|nr:unnamed protein product [Lactuca saligna]
MRGEKHRYVFKNARPAPIPSSETSNRRLITIDTIFSKYSIHLTPPSSISNRARDEEQVAEGGRRVVGVSKPGILSIQYLEIKRGSLFINELKWKREISSEQVSANLQGGYKGPRPKRELIADWVSKNDDIVRSIPIYVGGTSLFGVLFNRTISGIAPVADASSSQSRADLLAIGLAVTNILAGLVWLSIRPKSISVVPPRGVECERIHSSIPDLVSSELKWAWESLSGVTCSKSLVIVYDGICVAQIGYASNENEGEAMVVDAHKLMQGSIYQGIMKSGSQSYLANLSLYPGKSELPFLPSNTQAVILQPLGDKGIAIIGALQVVAVKEGAAPINEDGDRRQYGDDGQSFFLLLFW